jgi:hypothetical protein
MKSITLPMILFFVVSLLASKVHAQQNAAEYLDKVNAAQGNIQQDFFNYMSAVFHGKSARKVERNRKELVTALYKAKSTIGSMKPYNTDTTLKSATHKYLTILLDILNNDFSKIVNMEEIAEESYDNMEAYMLAQEKANEKLNAAGDAVDLAYKNFAAKYSVNLVEREDKITRKLEVVGKVSTYYHGLYLIFFKSFKQEAYLTLAINSKNVSAIEQNRTTLAANADEGLNKLNAMTSFDGDESVLTAGKKLLEFYKEEATDKTPLVIDFLVKSAKMEEMKKNMDAKGERSKADIDDYNNAIKEYNAAVNEYNKVNTELNKKRTRFTEDWNNAVERFLNRHTPR